MEEDRKKKIIESGKEYFRTIIIPKHINNVKKLKLKDFKINPFLANYLASFLCGNTEPESLAKALIYPRILGTSISTSFGSNIQKFISTLAAQAGTGSGIEGIDIEFIDAIDGRKKYCQCKASPQTINHDDVTTIMGHFAKLANKARLDHLNLSMNDMIVGILYGSKSELSDHYKKIDNFYPVYCGEEFWEHVTGDKEFYVRLSHAFGEVVEEDHIDGSQIILDKVTEIAAEIKKKGDI